MNLIFQALVIVALIAPILLGLLLGSMRGLRRSIVRLVLVALSVVLAFCLRQTLTDLVINLEVEGVPLGEYIASQMQGLSVPAETAANLVELMVVAVTFLVSLGLFMFITWAILFPILKLIFCRTKMVDDGNGHLRKKKHNGFSRLLGSVLGLAQGIAVAVICVTVLNGLFFNIANIAQTVNDMQTETQTYAESDGSISESDIENYEKFFNSMVEYNDSGIRKFISKMGGDKLFDRIVTIETEDGKKLTLTGQIDALRGLIGMGKELSAIQNLDMKGGLSSSTADSLTQIFNKLDEINGNLSDESKETINVLIAAVANEMMPEMNVDFSKIDFKEISFANEGQVIADLSAYRQEDFANLTDEQAKQKATDIVDTVMKSDIILPLLSSNSEFTIGLEGSNYDLAKQVIESYENDPSKDQDKVEMLRSFFGLNG